MLSTVKDANSWVTDDTPWQCDFTLKSDYKAMHLLIYHKLELPTSDNKQLTTMEKIIALLPLFCIICKKIYNKLVLLDGCSKELKNKFQHYSMWSCDKHFAFISNATTKIAFIFFANINCCHLSHSHIFEHLKDKIFCMYEFLCCAFNKFS